MNTLPPVAMPTDLGGSDIKSLQYREDKDVAEQLEAVFISMLIKEMRTAGSEEGLFAGDASDTFGGLFDQFMGEHIAAAGGLGMNRLLNQQLGTSADTDAAPRQQAMEAYQNGISISRPATDE